MPYQGLGKEKLRISMGEQCGAGDTGFEGDSQMKG
jgi:hypothetical protein